MAAGPAAIPYTNGNGFAVGSGSGAAPAPTVTQQAAKAYNGGALTLTSGNAQVIVNIAHSAAGVPGTGANGVYRISRATVVGGVVGSYTALATVPAVYQFNSGTAIYQAAVYNDNSAVGGTTYSYTVALDNNDGTGYSGESPAVQGTPTGTTSSVISPMFESAVFIAGQSTLFVTLTERDSPPIQPSTGVTGFAVTVNGVARTVSSATASGKIVSLVLASPLAAGDTVQVSYSPGNVTDSANNAMAAFSAQNAVVATTAPVQIMVPSGGRIQAAPAPMVVASSGKIQGSAGKIYLGPMPTRTDIGAPMRPPVGQLWP